MTEKRERQQPQNIRDLLTDLKKEREAYRSNDEATGEFWEHDPARWVNDPNYQKWAEHVVERPAFWSNNYLSTDYRIPVNVVGTNSARAMATNAMEGHMWEDFSSKSYRSLRSVGTIDYFNLYKGEDGEWDQFSPRHKIKRIADEGIYPPEGGGGPGFYRVPSLISIWATAPFLHNNSLGLYNNDPSVEGRLEAFDDAIRKLLWPEKRLESSSYNGATAERLKRDRGLVWRTPQETSLKVDGKKVPNIAHKGLGLGQLHKHKWFAWLHAIFPAWLPSAVLLLGSLLSLLLSNKDSRRSWALGILAVAVVLALLRWFAGTFPQFSIGDFLRRTNILFPVVALLIVGAVLSLRIWGEKKLRYAGLAIILLAISIAAAGFVANTFEEFSVGDLLRSINPIVLPLAVLGIVAAVLFFSSRPRTTRLVGYVLAILGLVLGAVVYFNAGKLGDVTIGPIPAARL